MKNFAIFHFALQYCDNILHCNATTIFSIAIFDNIAIQIIELKLYCTVNSFISKISMSKYCKWIENNVNDI